MRADGGIESLNTDRVPGSASSITCDRLGIDRRFAAAIRHAMPPGRRRRVGVERDRRPAFAFDGRQPSAIGKDVADIGTLTRPQHLARRFAAQHIRRRRQLHARCFVDRERPLSDQPAVGVNADDRQSAIDRRQHIVAPRDLRTIVARR